MKKILERACNRCYVYRLYAVLFFPSGKLVNQLQKLES